MELPKILPVISVEPGKRGHLPRGGPVLFFDDLPLWPQPPCPEGPSTVGFPVKVMVLACRPLSEELPIQGLFSVMSTLYP